MAGRIKSMIDSIISQRSMGNQFLERTTRTKILLKGINPGKYTETSEDDPVVISKLQTIAIEFDTILQ